MFFSKQTILNLIKSKKILIDPFDEKYLGSLSYEMHLGGSISQVLPMIRNEFDGHIPKDKKLLSCEITDDGYLIEPQQFIIAKSREKIFCSSDIMGFFDGKASLAQIGLFAHISSMLIEPEINSVITCEIFNCSKYPIRLYKDQKIGQVIFSNID